MSLHQSTAPVTPYAGAQATQPRLLLNRIVKQAISTRISDEGAAAWG